MGTSRRRLFFDSLASSEDCCVIHDASAMRQSTVPPPPATSLQGTSGSGKRRRLVEPPSAARKSRRPSPVVIVADSSEDDSSYKSPERSDVPASASIHVSPRRMRSQELTRGMPSRAIPLDLKELNIIDLTLDNDSDEAADDYQDSDLGSDIDQLSRDKTEADVVARRIQREVLLAGDLYVDLTDESATPMLGHSEALKYLAHAYEEVIEDDKNLYKLSDDIVRTEMATCANMSDLVRQSSQADLFRMTTYGEMKEEAFSSTIIPLLQLRESDVFYDMGCGTAKPVLQVALETTCRVSKGIELFANRVRTGRRALRRLRKTCPNVLRSKEVMIVQGDIVRPPSDANLLDATVVFINNLVFTDDLMLAVMEQLRQMRQLRRVIVSKKLCNRHSVRQCEHSQSACMLFEHPPREAKVEASWTAKDVSVYVYVRAGFDS
ncbi:hypothetical protein H310_09147 [Aphanomyces invadans]|uniref:Histone-lysine N-methyltransferase, H3 lysine-79 specific n=1 Tax=Aphanomyces invadans TaxID=157072 RepID=A0A024TVZ9_9STRA|nr:hypothetical protein H310_09147 [Aphanomyces invadans]ETV97796.1 hypothetical protein H310_09147 [Aphanomyces invadans]|eukprot:XP_008873357.1 hypothetical protein H310_09147 [Aphanomyces invadans]